MIAPFVPPYLSLFDLRKRKKTGKERKGSEREKTEKTEKVERIGFKEECIAFFFS